MLLFQNLFQKKKRHLGLEKKPLSSTAKTRCPHCSEELSPTPTRSKKCDHCGNFVTVRTHYCTKEKVFLTESQLEKFEQNRKNYKNFKHFLDSFKEFLEISDLALDSLYLEHSKILCERYGAEPLLEDIVESISNAAIAIYPSVASLVHFQQAIFLHESGKEYHHVRAQDFIIELKGYQKLGFEKVKIVTQDGKSCDECLKLQEKVVTINSAITKQLLPCKKCTFKFREDAPSGWCRCSYSIDF